MKILTACVVAALAASAVGSAFAADSDKAVVMRDFTDTVAPAQQQAYEAGLKAYNQCLHEHHVKFGEPTVTHDTGNDYMYSVANAYGQTDADAIRKPFNDAVAKASDHYDKYNADLSYTAGK